MINLEVGKKYPGIISGEGVKLEYNKGFTLYVFIPQITYNEALGFKTGRYRFALTEIDGLLMFLSEFKGAIDLSDSPFHFGIYTDNRIEDLPKELETNQGLGIDIIVVDTATKLVKALRKVGLSNELSKKLIEICITQSNTHIDKLELDYKIHQIQGRYSADDLYKLAIVECEGR